MSVTIVEALKPGLSALNDFSSILTQAIEGIDDNVIKLRVSLDDTLNKLLDVHSTVNHHDGRLKHLESEFLGQREVVEKAMKVAATLEKNVSNQLDDATRSLHKELVIQRTITKMDISSLRGKLSQSMSEMLGSIISPQKDAMPVYNPNYTTAESIKFLVEKVQKLDDAIGLQNTVNQHLSNAVGLGNEEMIQKVYDSLFEDITSLNSALSTELQQSREENHSLKNSLKEVKAANARQERMIYDILDALASKEKLKQLRSEIRKDKSHHSYTSSKLGGREPEEDDFEGEKKDGSYERGFEGDGELIRKRSPSQHSYRSRRTTDRGKRSYEIKLHHINETSADLDKEGPEEVKPTTATDHTELTEGLLEDVPSSRKPQIQARLSTLVRRQSPKKQKIKPVTGINDELIIDETEAYETIDDGKLVESNEVADAPSSMPIKSVGKRNTESNKSSRPSKVVQKVKQIQQQRTEEASDEGEDLEEDEEDDEVIVETKKSKRGKSNSVTTRKSRVASPKTRDTRKDTLKAANFYRGDEQDIVEDEEGNEYRPRGEDHKRANKIIDSFEKLSNSSTATAEEAEVVQDDKQEIEGEINEAVDYDKNREREEEEDGNSRLTGEESSLFNDGSESLFNEDSSIGRHLIDVLESNNIETANVINSLRDEYNDRLDTLETTLATFKRIAYVIDDLKIGFEAVRKKVEAVTTGETFEEKLNSAMMAKIGKLKEQWSRVYSELVFALENVNQGELDREIVPDLLGNKPLTFFQRAKELSYAIEDGLDDFNPRDTMELTLEKLFPSLDKMQGLAEQLIEADNQARISSSLDYSFDDLLCSDLTPSLRGLMVEATVNSIPVLDEGVAKIRMSRQLKQLMDEIQRKADKQGVAENENELRRLMQQKVDLPDFMAVTSKLASTTEVQRMQQLLNEGHYSGSTNTVHNSLKDLDPSSLKPLTEQPDFVQLLERLNALANKQYELEVRSEKLVPKEEVHEALKAIVAEIKNLRKNCVLLPIFREGLKSKADIAEVEKLVKTITEVVGDYNFSADFATSAAAIHAKCLICDKPVSSHRARTANHSRSNNNTATQSAPLISRTMSQAGYDKTEDETLQKKPTGSIMKRVNIPNPAISKPAKAKVISEMTIIRSTIEPLPEINDSLIESPRPQSSTNVASAEIQYKQRIRNSAGGGMGPNYKMDTR